MNTIQLLYSKWSRTFPKLIMFPLSKNCMQFHRTSTYNVTEFEDPGKKLSENRPNWTWFSLLYLVFNLTYVILINKTAICFYILSSLMLNNRTFVKTAFFTLYLSRCCQIKPIWAHRKILIRCFSLLL